MEPDVSAKAVNGFVTAGLASVVVRPINRFRTSLIICNDSATVVYLTYGDLAVLGTGIRLNAGGGVHEINTTNLYRGAISAISTVAARNLSWVEVE